MLPYSLKTKQFRAIEWNSTYIKGESYLMLEILQGKKHKDDKIVLVNGHQITFEEVAHILVTFCNNEEVIYPPPRFKGAEYFKAFINECMDSLSVSAEILVKYKLPKKL